MISSGENSYWNTGEKQEFFYLDKTKKENGPMMIRKYNSKGYIMDDCFINTHSEFNREDGPAIIYYDRKGQIKKKEYWLDGEQIKNLEKINQINQKDNLSILYPEIFDINKLNEKEKLKIKNRKKDEKNKNEILEENYRLMRKEINQEIEDHMIKIESIYKKYGIK